MKKIIALILVIFMLCLCGCQSNNQGETELQDIKTEESLSDKLVREMDSALQEDLKNPDNYSTAGMASVTLKYAEKWQEIADEYYNKLMEFDGILQLNDHYYSSDDFHTFISEMKTNWNSIIK